MRIDPRQIVPPLGAIAILLLIVTLTREALNLSGAWRRASEAAAAAPNPFSPVEKMLATEPTSSPAIPRDPLRWALPAHASGLPSRQPARPARPLAPSIPQLTSIVFDADPRATVRWAGRDYSVRSGTLFAEFRVISITRDQVTLERGAESVILRLPQRGDAP